MSYAYINKDYAMNKPKFWLCLPYPRRTGIRKLTEIYNVNLKLILGRVHELTFDIPAEIERNHELIKNPLIEQFNGYYQVKMEWNGVTEYFVYTVGNRKSDNGGKTLSYKLYSSAYLISKKLIRLYEETSKPLSYHANLFLKETNWKLDYVDADFDLMNRHMEFTEANALQCLYDLATKFNAIIKFNSVNQTISFHKPENIGINKGMTFKDGIFIESLGYEVNFDEIVTRLYVYGSDGLEFRRLSPTGSNYIEDLSWFMFPFECDANYNVLKKSKWMTDDLCIAYLKYQKKLNDYTNTFNTLTVNKTNKEDDITQRESELSTLEFEMNQVENELWVLNKTYFDQAPNRLDHQNAVVRKSNLQTLINSKKNQITNLKSELNSIESQIRSLQDSVSVDNNFTKEQIVEMNEFIHHKTYTNDSITNDEDLLEDGIKAFKDVNQPPITLNLQLINFLNDIEHSRIHNRIALGDVVKVKSEKLDIYMSLKIIEVSYNLENENIMLTISNEKDLRDDMAKLVDKIYSASSTSTTVDMNKYRWELGEIANNGVTNILNSNWDAAKQALIGGHEGSTILDKYGLKSVNSSDSNNFLFINNGIIGATSDGLNTISVSISSAGVHAERLVGKIILGNKLWIEDDVGVIDIHSALMTVYDQNGNPRVYLGRYPTPENPNQFKYGLRVIDGAFDMRTSSTTNKGMQIDGNGLRAFNSNGVKVFEVDASTGQVTIVGGVSIKTHPDSNRGVEIDGNGFRIYGYNGQLVFNADNFGNIYYTGRLDGAYGNVDNLTGSINNMDGTFKGDLVASGGTFTGTLNGVDGNFTGSLTAATGTFNGLITGTLSAQTASLIELDVDQLRANNAQINNLSAISANLGNITAGDINGVNITGSRINTTYDLYVGNKIIFQNSGSKRIMFRDTMFIGDDGGGSLELNNLDDIIITTPTKIIFNGTVDFSGANVIGLS